MNSIKKNLKILPTSSPTLTSKNHRITRANTLLFKSFNIDQNQQDLKKFNSETDLLSSKHIQWITNNQSFQNSLTDFKSLSMTDFNPDIHNESQDQILTSTSNPVRLSEDEDDRELVTSIKTFTDQASQAILEDIKPKKKTKSSHSKKTKSSSKRPKGLQIPPSTLTISSSNRIISNGDSIPLTSSMKVSPSIAKTEENNGTKSLITVDTSKARSNLEVVRLCLRELGWKEVEILKAII